MTEHPGPPQVEWPRAAAPDRLAPRECIGKAQEEMNKAWCADNYYEGMYWVRAAVDWLRRGLEQMAPVQDDRHELESEAAYLRAALRGLYDFLPRWSCKSMEPDGCPVCVAKAALASGEENQALASEGEESER